MSMFFPRPQENKIKPTLYPGPFLIKKFRSHYSDFEIFNLHNDCLLKYFPKYYRNLGIPHPAHPKSAQHKVRLVKVIHHFHCEIVGGEKGEKTLKRLLRTNRKTLKSLPKSQHDFCPGPGQRHDLSLYFPRVTSLDLSYNQCFKGYHHLGVLTRSIEKEFYRSYGYFWGGNRFVKKLTITNHDLYYWIMLKKLGESKRFLESLETLQLSVNQFSERSMVRRSLVELLKNKEVLKFVTHLKFDEYCKELMNFWQPIESLINLCHRLSFLSLPINESVRLSLNLCRLENLQELDLGVNSLAIFISGVELPQSLRKIIFKGIGYMPMSDLPEIFGFGDGRSLLSLEKFQSQQRFFDKWRNLHNLKVLKLLLPISARTDNIFKNFIVPLLKAIPQLETFIFKWSAISINDPSPLDLDVLLEGIENLRSLQNIKISPCFKSRKSSLIVTYNPQKVYFLPHITSIKINAELSTDFNLKKFINTLFCNVKSKVPEMNRVVKLSSLKISCAKQFIKILQILHIVSEFKTVKFDMEIDLVDQTLPSLMENFRYPIYIPKNLLLAVEIKLFDSASPIYLTEAIKQHLRIVFSQLDFTISYQEKPQDFGFGFGFPIDIILLSNSQKRIP